MRSWSPKPRTAHPRSRGENLNQSTTEPTASGSSPLTRGKHGCGRGWRVRRRLIPAHAGKTFRSSFSVCRGAAHPRSRGENRVIGSPLAILHGSSPLTRGKLKRVGVTLARDRLIPAHAGKTASWRWPSLPVKAHPRSRGENTTSRGSRPRRSGSSPLTRGKRPLRNVKSLQGRLIPAHAGKTLPIQRRSNPPGAHPRSRGENSGAASKAWVAGGSSPLTRGKLATVLDNQLWIGLIPAHAGKTWCTS